MYIVLHNKGRGLVAFGFTMFDGRILIDAFTDGITDPYLDVVKANVMDRLELVGDFDAVAKCYGYYIKQMSKTCKISEVKTGDNLGDDVYQGDGGGKRRGGRGGHHHRDCHRSSLWRSCRFSKSA